METALFGKISIFYRHQFHMNFKALATMKITDLHNVEDKVYYCDNQQHLKLGSGEKFYSVIMFCTNYMRSEDTGDIRYILLCW